ncbi:MAG: helix-turn-helix transcriptional regulator [Thermaerobacter sp.]|nr:helix-turn-helix transcriptional regulator [Thermaerobacter sp.]
MPHNVGIGHRIRQLREANGWSQQQLALKIPLSQKQLSRIEQAQVSSIDRQLLIRIAEALDVPVASGELNQWLYTLGYRPHIRPLLPLPPKHQELVDQFMPYPATLLDIGWFARWWNPAMERFYNLPNGSLIGLDANLFVQYFMPHGVMHRAYPASHTASVIIRLLWDWAPYEQEPWLLALKTALEAYLGISLAALRERHQVKTMPPSPNFVVPLSLHVPRQRPLRFRSFQVPVAHRPDLKITVYEPADQRAEDWCQAHQHPVADHSPR